MIRIRLMNPCLPVYSIPSRAVAHNVSSGLYILETRKKRQKRRGICRAFSKDFPEGGYPRTETPEKEITATPRTGWPKKRAGAKTLDSSRFSTSAWVCGSFGPLTMR